MSLGQLRNLKVLMDNENVLETFNTQAEPFIYLAPWEEDLYADSNSNDWHNLQIHLMRYATTDNKPLHVRGPLAEKLSTHLYQYNPTLYNHWNQKLSTIISDWREILQHEFILQQAEEAEAWRNIEHQANQVHQELQIHQQQYHWQPESRPLVPTPRQIGYAREALRKQPTQARLWNFCNSDNFVERFHFPKIIFWGQVNIDAFLKPHKKNLDRLILTQFFLANGFNPEKLQDFLLKFHIGALNKTLYDAAAHRQVKTLIDSDRTRQYSYFNVAEQKTMQKY